MKSENKERRRREIQAAAYEVLAEKGYAGASMLSIAKRAGASNETLYRWYGSKQALFQALVEENARGVSDLLRQSMDADRPALETLAAVGPVLLTLLVGDRAVALNRAAAADVADGGELGRTLARSGREAVVPLLAMTFERARDAGDLAFSSTREVVERYLGLLISDLQVRRVIGAIEAPGAEEIEARATAALRAVGLLYAPAG